MSTPDTTANNPSLADGRGAHDNAHDALAVHRTTASLELACLLFFIEAIMWIVPILHDSQIAYASFSTLIAALLAFCYVRDGVGVRDLGLRLGNMVRVLDRLWLPLGAFVLIVVVIGLVAGTLRFSAKFFSVLAGAPLWALLQQYMLLAFANRRLRVIAGQGTSVIATAALFSLLHMPNPVLMLACAFGGYIWAREYERDPNLLANAITHTIASAFLASSLPHSLLKNMVVGYNYFFR